MEASEPILNDCKSLIKRASLGRLVSSPSFQSFDPLDQDVFPSKNKLDQDVYA